VPFGGRTHLRVSQGMTTCLLSNLLNKTVASCHFLPSFNSTQPVNLDSVVCSRKMDSLKVINIHVTDSRKGHMKYRCLAPPSIIPLLKGKNSSVMPFPADKRLVLFC